MWSPFSKVSSKKMVKEPKILATESFAAKAIAAPTIPKEAIKPATL